MKRILYFTACIAVALSTVSCEDFLGRVPKDKFDADTFFQTETDLILYSNGLINSGLPGSTAITMGNDLYTDLCATTDSHENYREGYLSANNASGWSYSNFAFLRQVAYMLENMPNAKENVDPKTYNHYEGVARFWRAYATYSKVKQFGDCYFIDHVISPDDPMLYGPREDREYVVHRIVEDLEFAVENCRAKGDNIHSDGRIYINKFVAIAMAARICLHEGTFRKYHEVNPSTGKPWTNEYENSEDLLRLALYYSKRLVDSGEFSLHKNFREIFTSKSLVTDEVIWGRTNSDELGVRHNTTREFCKKGKNFSPTKDFVRMFLNKDGSPAAPNLSPDKEFENRDKRLEATVLGPSQKQQNSAGNDEAFVPNFTLTVTGYQWMKWIMTDAAARTENSMSVNSIPVLRYAEVLLIYAEAAAELGEMTKEIWDQTVWEIRSKHGGIEKNIYPGDASYEGDDNLRHYYTFKLSNTSDISDILLEIRRERATELMLEGDSHYDDLMRWRLGDLIERRSNGKAWRGIYLTEEDVNKGWTFNGKKFTVSTTALTSETNFRITQKAPQNFTLSEGTHGYLLYYYDVTWEDRMYLKPIPLTAININPNLGQNEGWQWM